MIDLDDELSSMLNERAARVAPAARLTEFIEGETHSAGASSDPVMLALDTRPRSRSVGARWWLVAAATIVVVAGGLFALANRESGRVPAVADGESNEVVCTSDVFSFDSMIYPWGLLDGYDATFQTPEDAAVAYLDSIVATEAVPDLGYSNLRRLQGAVDDLLTILDADVVAGARTGTIRMVVRDASGTDGPRFMVQAAASAPDGSVTATIVDGVHVVVDPASPTTIIEVRDIYTGDLVASDTIEPVGRQSARLDAELAHATAAVRTWALGPTTINFTEIQVMAGSTDYGDGWQILQQTAGC